MTFDELKAMHAAMTPGPWEVRGHYVCVGRGGGDKQETGDGRLGEGGIVFSAMVESATEQNFPGIVALHNAFPALVERYEAMRVALEEAEWQGFSLSDTPTCPVCDGSGLHIHTCSLGNALALVAKPLTEGA